MLETKGNLCTRDSTHNVLTGQPLSLPWSHTNRNQVKKGLLGQLA